jgi:predicted GNAT family N-acyltransferase
VAGKTAWNDYLQTLIPITADDFERYYQLRWNILRKPWNQPVGSEKDDLENISQHLMIINDDKVIAVGRLHFNSASEAQIRYMAVADNFRKKGAGLLILRDLENYGVSNKADKIILHARENALGFYTKQGYEVLEKSHMLYNCIQHFKMRKTI